jgi:hypothetical protein
MEYYNFFPNKTEENKKNSTISNANKNKLVKSVCYCLKIVKCLIHTSKIVKNVLPLHFSSTGNSMVTMKLSLVALQYWSK